MKRRNWLLVGLASLLFCAGSAFGADRINIDRRDNREAQVQFARADGARYEWCHHHHRHHMRRHDGC